MEGFLITQRVNWLWVRGAYGFFAASLVAAIFLGPLWAGGFALAGMGVGGAGALAAFKKPAGFPRPVFSITAVLANGFCLLTAWVLFRLFLAPFPVGALQPPRFRQVVDDPAGRFRVLAPEHWSATFFDSGTEFGVVLHPWHPNAAAGLSEARVVFRRLPSVPPEPDAFLESIATALSPGAAGLQGGAFSVHTESARLMDGRRGAWAILDVRRFWVPFRQVSLFGLKEGATLCSISATGLRSRADLARVICLGLFEKTTLWETSMEEPQVSM